MKKILFVVDERKMGGISILLENLLPKLNNKDKNIDLLILHNNGDRLVNIENVNIIYGTKYFETIDLTFKEVLKSKKIVKILKKIILFFDMKTGIIKKKIKRERKKILTSKYDIEIAFKDGFCAFFTVYGNSFKKIHWLHYDYGRFNPNKKYDNLFKTVLPKFDKIIAVSKKVSTTFNDIYHLENKTTIISNYVDVNKIKNSLTNKDIKDSQTIAFICVGRLHQIKGYDRLIEVFKQLNEKNKLINVSLNIYGDGPERENILKKISDYSLEKIIKLKGQIDNPYNEMQKSDFLLLPSYFESFGIVIVESMSCGTPVLACDTSATSELITDGYNGIIVENSTDGLHEGINRILEDKSLIDNFKKNLKSYDYEKNNKKIIKKIDDLLK